MAAVLHLPCAAVPLHLLGVDSGPSRGEGSLPSTLLDLSEGRGKAQQGLPQQIRPNNLGCVWRCCLLDRAFGTASGRWNLGFVETLRPNLYCCDLFVYSDLMPLHLQTQGNLFY